MKREIASNCDKGELRLFLEEVIAGLVRYRHVVRDGVAPHAISVLREVLLEENSLFADILVHAPPASPYFIEVKNGLAADDIVGRIAEKFGRGVNGRARELLVIVDDFDDVAAERLRERVADVCGALTVEVWHERRLLSEIKAHFGLQVSTLKGGDLHSIRDAINAAEWRYAFETSDARLAQTLLWHFSPWTLKGLHDAGIAPSEVLKPGNYPQIIILMADICAFSSYVRDTPDDESVRQILTAFYSQARHAVHECGGMLYQFVGDEVVALFGFPRPHADAGRDAVTCARRLLDIGNSISDHWQRRLDRLQKSRGVHIGIARGDLNLMPLRAFSRFHMGFIGDSINMAARLMAAAGPGEVIVSNGLHKSLARGDQLNFSEREPVEAKNVGLITCWQLDTMKPSPAP